MFRNETNKVSRFTPSSTVHAVTFCMKGNEDIENESYVTVSNKNSYRGNEPVPRGIQDTHMGVPNDQYICPTCLNKKTDCPGHLGILYLRYPVKNPIFMFTNRLLIWLRAFCFNCGLTVYSGKINAKKSQILREYANHAKVLSSCDHCGEDHPLVVRDKTMPLMIYKETYIDKRLVGREPFYNNKIYDALSRISDEQVIAMGKPLSSHPKKLIIDRVQIPSNPMRPDSRKGMGGRVSHNDLTKLIRNIVATNEGLPTTVPDMDRLDVDARSKLARQYNKLDEDVYNLVKGTSTSKQNDTSNKPSMSISSRIPGKRGRCRNELTAVRSDFMTRSVITEDNLLRPDEVGVPVEIAKEETIPITVQSWNLHIVQKFFLNRENYPGCNRLIKKSNGQKYIISKIPLDYELQYGDIIERHLIDGDIIGFGRQPSLLFASIGGHRVKVLYRGSTLRLNISSCKLYNADFDGDCMLGIIPRSEASRNEVATTSGIGNWFISYKDQSPFLGLEQDTLIGMFEFTRHNVKLNKWHAMMLFSKVDTQILRKVKFDKDMYTGRELVSKCLPRVSYVGKDPYFYNKTYEKNKWIDYEKSDIEVKITNGELISGVLDKSAVGTSSNNSLFHVIHNEHGAEMAIDCIYSFQQLITKFFYNHGFTVGIKDMLISKEAQLQIKMNTAKIIDESHKIHQRLVKRKIYAPIGQTLEEYYEALQINALNPGDDFIGPILEDIIFYENGLCKLVFSGSKGKIDNVISINAAVGQQSINNKRAPKQFGWKRTSPYFQRYDPRPIANGYIQQSFREGLSSESLLFIAQETRHALISNALSTALSGEQNRCAVKNLETAVVNSLRMVAKNSSIIQMLFAETGVDPRYSEMIKFPTITIDDATLKEKYHMASSSFDKEYHNGSIQKMLDDEFAQIKADREFYRSLFMRLENNNPGQTMMSDKIQMPVNIVRIIADVKHSYRDISGKGLDPGLTIKKVTELCEDLPYIHLNNMQEKKRGYVPDYIVAATKLLGVLIRIYLSTANLIKESITDELLNKIIENIRSVYKKSLIAYGTAMGIIASQCLSEPMTQFVLNSKHRSGAGGGTKTNQIVRIKEILGAKLTEKMKNPLMILRVAKEWETNKAKVQELANYIEMMTFKRFVNKCQIFFEKYGQPTHPQYVGESEIIKSFEHRHAGMQIPNDLSRWVLRFELDKDELILKSMKLDQIVLALRKAFKELFIVYTPENSNNLIMRAYIRNTFFKNIKVNDALVIQEKVEALKERMYGLVIRGINGVIRAYVSELRMSSITDTNAVIMKPIYAIITDGTNLKEVLNLPFLDLLHCQSDSILEIAEIYGIDAARNKILHEIMNSMKDSCTAITASIFADEMTFSGHPSSIEKTGLSIREPTNVLLQTSFQRPIQNLERAALENITSVIGGVSAQQMIGSGVRLGTTYASILMNQDFIENNIKTLDEQIKEL